MSVSLNLGFFKNCPICLKVPTDKIIRCRNWHSICEKCTEYLTECPRCRVSFDEGKIRDYLGEELLKHMPVRMIGASRNEGPSSCYVKRFRKRLNPYPVYYDFSLSLVNICKILGWRPQCTFQATQPVLILEHLTETHQLHVFRDDHLSHSSRFEILRLHLEMKVPVCVQVLQWEVRILGSLRRFLIVAYFNNKNEGEVSFLGVLLGMDLKLASRCMLGMEIKICENNIIWKWNGNPIHYKNLEYLDVQSVVDQSPFRIPMNRVDVHNLISGSGEHMLAVKYELKVSVVSIK